MNTNIKIILTDDVINYFKKLNVNTITLDMQDRMCWLQTGIPEVYLGKHLDIDKEGLYEVVVISKITVYYYRNLKTVNGEIIVQLSKFLFMKKLEVRGIEF